MTSKFEQLIEYVINDEEAKAKELFHDIVVEKSREIYENLMQEEEELDEADEAALDESDEEIEEGLENGHQELGGDASEEFMKEVETEEEGMYNEDESTAEFDDEAEEDGDEVTHDIEDGEEDLEDRVVDLEDKLDELMAEFEDLLGSDDEANGSDGFEPGEGGDAIEVDDTEEMSDEMMEAISLKAAPKPVTSEEGSVNKKPTVAANSGARGAVAKPVSTGTSMGGKHDSSAYSNSTKDLGVTPTQDAGSKAFKTAAPKPVTTQAAGVNARTPFPKG